ncbi:ribosomal L1 domain-containing protein CG13096 [Coccinella septempunctata]|uniref:ribosomal L1 domain-containing protein CG13096 n=1 Tax=Coccinella septempunctata TaxID=41139 RepID=UPI001D0811DE|nr:ribosomal L1 domain-containing protein CG13096 [Coccinella septempunctata]
MAIVQTKSVSKKSKLDGKIVRPSKTKKVKPVKEQKQKIIIQKPEKTKPQRKLKNLISLKTYDPKIEVISSKYNVPIELVEANVRNIVKLVDENPKVQNPLFDNKFSIFLQLNVIKVPKCYPKLVRVELEHSLLDPEDEVCFIVPDLKQFKNKEYEKHIEYYEDFFKQKGVENIKKIITLHQLKSEYENFELKRGLVELYDMFLVDGRISGRVVHQLGKIFYKKRKIPTPIKMDSLKLKSNIEAAMKKSTFQIHGNGDSFMLQIGHSKMCERELVENVFTALQNIDKVFPGGMKNMRSINIFARRGSSLPIYVSLANPNTVKVPKLAVKKPKLSKVVEGELTTKLNVRVKVKPTGEVIVKKQ